MKPHRKIQLAIIAIVMAYIAFHCIPVRADETQIPITVVIIDCVNGSDPKCKELPETQTTIIEDTIIYE